MKKNIFRVIGLSLAMFMTMTACTAPAASTTPSPTAASASAAPSTAGGKTMQVLLAEEPTSENSFSRALKAWEAATGNKAELLIIPYDDQLTKFPSMAKAGSVPDLVSTPRLHQLYPAEFLNMNKEIDLSIFEPTALKIIGKDYSSENLVGLPLQYTITTMYYNKAAFEKAGLKAPTVDAPWTWDQLYANAKVLQEKGGVKYGFASDFSRARYDTIMYANGGSLFEKSGDSFVITSNSAKNVKALTDFVKANNDGIMPKAIWAGGTTDAPADYFQNGDVGILLSGSWNYQKFSAGVKTFQFGNMPSPKGEIQASIIGGAALAVPKNGKNKDVALSFMKWFYQADNFQNYMQDDKGMSSLKAVAFNPDSDADKANFAVIQNEVKYVPDTFMIDESSSWRKYLDNQYRDYLKKAVSGELTPQQALDGFSNDMEAKSGWKIKK